jgi:predicted MPP superfamily phosphohydrolase
MDRVIGAAAEASGADLVMDGGDATMDGTSVESYCIDSYVSAMPKGVPIVAVLGNHDTAQTGQQERAAGETVLDGEVVKEAGLRILGDADRTHTEVAQGTTLLGDETTEEMGERLADEACAADPAPDVLLVHSPYAATDALKRGCVPLAVTGHLHSRQNPVLRGDGLLYTGSSAGRDTKETTTIGPLGSDAEITVFLFDAQSRLVAWQLVTVHPDATATLSRIVPVLVQRLVTPEAAEEEPESTAPLTPTVAPPTP